MTDYMILYLNKPKHNEQNGGSSHNVLGSFDFAYTTPVDGKEHVFVVWCECRHKQIWVWLILNYALLSVSEYLFKQCRHVVSPPALVNTRTQDQWWSQALVHYSRVRSPTANRGSSTQPTWTTWKGHENTRVGPEVENNIRVFPKKKEMTVFQRQCSARSLWI